ncbi:hypothetical protein CTI12_AA408160 [Artemisia annua]|uniref:DUF4283 domain-containing protein n=1 Tax=Artemisia annua TaxID=35608 RepID=A0A2U1M8N3_ARTAN|nr:hypothetical protein CTI12_AA408160 [Artemisia annua]
MLDPDPTLSCMDPPPKPSDDFVLPKKTKNNVSRASRGIKKNLKKNNSKGTIRSKGVGEKDVASEGMDIMEEVEEENEEGCEAQPIPQGVSQVCVDGNRSEEIVGAKDCVEVVNDGTGNKNTNEGNLEACPTADVMASEVLVDKANEVPAMNANSGTHTRSSLSFASALQRRAGSTTNKLRLYPLSVNEEGKEVVDLDPLIAMGNKMWDLTLVGYFVGMKMSYREISWHLRRMWRMYGLDKIITMDNGLYYLKFNSVEGMQTMIENGPWLVDQKPLFLH